MRKLIERIARRQQLSAADKRLLRPKETRIGPYGNRYWNIAGFLSSVAALFMCVGMLPNVSLAGFWLGALVLAGIFSVLGWLKRHPTVDPSDIQDGRLPPELEHVAVVFESMRLTYELVLVYEVGPAARLLPHVLDKQLVVTKRFWTELSPEEQRCAVALIARRGALQEQLLLWVLVFVVSSPFFLILGGLLTPAFGWLFGNLIGFQIVGLGLAALYHLNCLLEWRRAARRAKAPDAPVYLLRKLLEEARWPIQRLHYRWLLRAFERRMTKTEENAIESAIGEEQVETR